MRSDHLAKHVKTHKNGDGGSESKKGDRVKKGEDFGQQQQHQLGGFGEYSAYVHGIGISEQ